MKKHIFLLSISLTGVIVSSCHKINDVHLKRACKIEEMNCFAPGFGEVILPRYFTYNQNGNPVMVEFSEQGTGADSYEFLYDNKHRLIRLFVSGTSKDTHEFTYNNEGDIIVDSSVDYYRRHLETKFYYDAQKRIIKIVNKLYEEEGVSEPSPYLNVEYISELNYDNKGNLIREGVVYDDKINIHRTNKIWMFLDRDYSLNNPSYGYSETGLPSAYNDFGLPLNHTYFLGYDATEVVYDCVNLQAK